MAGDMVLDNIEEFIFDEDRVVSYKWLSRTLSLHVNDAKRKLEEFIEQWRNEEGSKPPITVTFFLSGVQETTSGNELIKVAIVREDDLEKAKKNLKRTHCQHIYSIQKTALKDTGALYQTDYDETKKHIYECNKFSAISFGAAQPRDADVPRAQADVPNGHGYPVEKKAEERSQPTSQGSKKSKPKGLAAFMSKPKNEAKSEVKTDSKTDSKSDNKETTTKQAASKHGKGSLMRAFASGKKAPKPTADKKDDSPPPTEASKKLGDREDKTVTREESADREKKSQPDDASKEAPEKAPVEETKTAEEAPKETKAPTKKAPGKHGRSKPETKKAAKRGISRLDTESKSKQHNTSKRRRVVQQQDSSSSESEAEEDVEMMMEQEEEPEDTPIPPTPEPRSKATRDSTNETPTGGKKGRRKVWKKKRYLDDDGCMVTEKVFTSESEGEGEGEAEPSKDKKSPPEDKKEASPTSSKKRSPPSAGRKQSNIQSFFKKK